MASGSPLDAVMIQQLISQLAGGGAGGGMSMPGAGGGMMPGSPEDASQQQYARESTMLRQADPAAILKRITNLKAEIHDILSQTGMSLPGIARALGKAIPSLDAALKEAGTAAATASVTSSANPVSTPALPPPQGGAGMFGVGGGF